MIDLNVFSHRDEQDKAVFDTYMMEGSYVTATKIGDVLGVDPLSVRISSVFFGVTGNSVYVRLDKPTGV